MKGPVETVSMPVPWHCGHLSGLVPGSQPSPPHLEQVSRRVTVSSLVAPLAASENVRLTWGAGAGIYFYLVEIGPFG